MINHLLLNYTNQELGLSKPTARDNYAYHCPFCNHRKPKLEIQMTETQDGLNPWNCWACGSKGKTLFQLFRKLKYPREKIEDLKKIVKETKSYDSVEKITKKEIKLPKEFKSLKHPNIQDIEVKHILYYLKKRGITEADIIKYNIGYCESGRYAGRIIFPTYDKNYQLNFFDARTYKDSSLRYLKPDYSKNIIANEHLINWNLPIIICEGMFDAIAIKRNVIPLLGKIIQPELMKRLVSSTTQKIYIALDSDAIKKALEFCEMLMNEGKDVYLVEMGEDDASKMGFIEFTKHIQHTEKLTYSKLLEKRLET